ncbi:MAG: dihydrodipicolinate reductase [Frankiales bacterium]|nr:dihydrodipicolinate reductase [Frankiales bacterium]
MTYRVVQWTTGNVGQRSVIAVLDNPLLDLVGCYAWSPDKVGQDVGTLCGVEPVGILATDDVEALLALKPDCVVYNPKWPDVDVMCRILSAGINIVATAGFITGHALGDGRARIQQACRAGGASVFGSGMNPGFLNLLGLVSAGICDRVDRITMLESVDSTGYDSPETEQSVGFGQPLGAPGLQERVAEATAVFGDAVWLTGEALGIDLDEVRCVAEFATTTAPVDLVSWTIEPGQVAGVAASWQGWYDGRLVVDLRVMWRKGRTLEPDWKVEHGYVVSIEGRPNVRTKLTIAPPADFVATSVQDYMVLGMIITGLPAVNAIAAVCDARPGIVTYNDLPLIASRGFVSRSAAG